MEMCALPDNLMIWRRKWTAIEGNWMSRSGEKARETVRPQFNPAIMVDFQGTKITPGTGFLLLREIDERFGILGQMGRELEDARYWVHSRHSLLRMTQE
jgi:hypothetical protein